jgi:hypothetical protein
MQLPCFKDAESLLVAKLAPFPRLKIEARGMEANSSKRWFRIRDRASRKHFTVLITLATDFMTPHFDGLLHRFAIECGW